MEQFALGFLVQDNRFISHRSLIKVIFNPILRFFGFEIGTMMNTTAVLYPPKYSYKICKYSGLKFKFPRWKFKLDLKSNEQVLKYGRII